MSLRDAWETRAPEWVRWARSPELDRHFWSFHLPEFLRFVPAPGRLTVDVGCGEGRLGRVLAGSGHRVVGFDASLTSVRAAATHPEGHPVAVADAVRLPLPDDVADLAIAFMSLHDFDDVHATVAEVARVLAPDGRFCIALLHPVTSARLVDGYAADRALQLHSRARRPPDDLRGNASAAGCLLRCPGSGGVRGGGGARTGCPR